MALFLETIIREVALLEGMIGQAGLRVVTLLSAIAAKGLGNRNRNPPECGHIRGFPSYDFRGDSSVDDAVAPIYLCSECGSERGATRAAECSVRCST
jgi:hypothetical protein